MEEMDPMRISSALVAGLLICAPLTVRAEQKPTPSDLTTTAEIHQLVQDLADNHFAVRQKASNRLRVLGLEALPDLEKATDSPDPEVRHRAWELIDGWAAEGKVPALLFQLSSSTGTARALAADSLGKMGAAAHKAVPALMKAAQDKIEIVRCSAREALKNIQAQPEITVEVVAVDDDAKVGGSKRYSIEVSNTGTAPATNLRFVALVPQYLTMVGGLGIDHHRDGQRVRTVPLELAPNSKARLELVCKIGRKANGPLQVEVFADQLAQPLRAADNMPAQTGTNVPPPPQAPAPAQAEPVPMPIMPPPPPPPQK
jgi:uncharacterized repeat protein (TIGR01451 family)